MPRLKEGERNSFGGGGRMQQEVKECSTLNEILFFLLINYIIIIKSALQHPFFLSDSFDLSSTLSSFHTNALSVCERVRSPQCKCVHIQIRSSTCPVLLSALWLPPLHRSLQPSGHLSPVHANLQWWYLQGWPPAIM